MARQRVDWVKQSPQDAIWQVVRHLNIFSITDIVNQTNVDRKTATDYIKRLEAGRYIEKHTAYEENNRFIVLRDAGVHAPRVKRDGTPVTQGAGNMNMWRAMRMMKEFTPRDLAIHSSTDTVQVNEKTAKAYCTMLRKAKYLRVLKKAVPSKSQIIYKFILDTGPKPPQIQRVKQVYDPNIRKVTFCPIEGDHV